MKLKIERISAFDSLLFLSYNSYLVGFHPLHWPQRVFVDLTHRHTAEKKKKKADFYSGKVKPTKHKITKSALFKVSGSKISHFSDKI